MASAVGRVLLLLPTTTYKVQGYMDAAGRLGLDVVVGTDRARPSALTAPGTTIEIDPAHPERSVASIVEASADRPFDAIVGVDDETTVLAAMASRALGLRHNPVEAVGATRNKYETRRLLARAARPGPRFSRVALDADPAEVAGQADYPCVLKPLSLSTGRGVIRADDRRQFVAAFQCIRQILRDPEVARLKGATDHLLVEDYLAGEEFALEGLLEDGRLRVLALFDKPDPMDGPTFEETLLVTPSRQAPAVQRQIVDEVRLGCEALGLRHGPIHAELRLTDGTPWLIEMGARTIGGLCSNVLRFGDGMTLAQIVRRPALGRGRAGAERAATAVGVMMLPIPCAGILEEVKGIDDARRVPHVEGVTISLHRGARVVPLPEGHSYLGFVFARAESAERVEAALREAHACLEFVIQ